MTGFADEVKEKIRTNAVAVFRAVGGFGLSRVDFFVEQGTNEVIFNEINTLPGIYQHQYVSDALEGSRV